MKSFKRKLFVVAGAVALLSISALAGVLYELSPEQISVQAGNTTTLDVKDAQGQHLFYTTADDTDTFNGADRLVWQTVNGPVNLWFHVGSGEYRQFPVSGSMGIVVKITSVDSESSESQNYYTATVKSAGVVQYSVGIDQDC